MTNKVTLTVHGEIDKWRAEGREWREKVRRATDAVDLDREIAGVHNIVNAVGEVVRVDGEAACSLYVV